eukprot:1149402-Pelagomonas_calceolata.AAC.4
MALAARATLALCLLPGKSCCRCLHPLPAVLKLLLCQHPPTARPGNPGPVRLLHGAQLPVCCGAAVCCPGCHSFPVLPISRSLWARSAFHGRDQSRLFSFVLNSTAGAIFPQYPCSYQPPPHPLEGSWRALREPGLEDNISFPLIFWIASSSLELSPYLLRSLLISWIASYVPSERSLISCLIHGGCSQKLRRAYELRGVMHAYQKG